MELLSFLSVIWLSVLLVACIIVSILNIIKKAIPGPPGPIGKTGPQGEKGATGATGPQGRDAVLKKGEQLEPTPTEIAEAFNTKLVNNLQSGTSQDAFQLAIQRAFQSSPVLPAALPQALAESNWQSANTDEAFRKALENVGLSCSYKDGRPACAMYGAVRLVGDDANGNSFCCGNKETWADNPIVGTAAEKGGGLHWQ